MTPRQGMGGRVRRLNVILAALVVLGASGCARPAATPEQIEEAYTASRNDWDKATTAEAKLEIATNFLQEFPDTKHTDRLVGEAVDLLSDEMKRPADAETLIRTARGRVKDVDTARALAIRHVEILAKLGKSDDLIKVANGLAGDEKMEFFDRMSITEAAIAAKAWATALAFAEQAAAITADQLKAMNPKRYQTAADLERAVNTRRVWALADAGWAQANLGRVDDALATFAIADRLDSKQLPGNSESQLPVYWSRTLLKVGKAKEAADVVAANALYGGDKDAAALFEEAFKAQGLPGDFAAYVEQSRRRIAPLAPDFTLTDYNGKAHSFAALRAGEVTLLAFWFPT